jgi:GcrA cell cycle regulator
METVWTDDRINALTNLWSEGLSTAEIGRRLGITKNAVVGKAHRLSLTPRPSPVKTSSIVRPRVKPAPKVVSISGPTCSWPHGHPGEKGFHFCGARAVAGKPYCAEHAALAYVRPKSHSSNAA